MGEGREIFILDMGTQIKIADMARDLIRLSGFEPDVDINIEYVGLRPGEKLYEELITDGEDVVPTSHEKIMVLKGTECHLGQLNGSIDELARLAYEQDSEAIKKKLQKAVPEYKPQLHSTGVKAEQSKEVDHTESDHATESHLSISPTHSVSA
jgi:FlaA1/EpsC-like NDP-sugar epimerase